MRMIPSALTNFDLEVGEAKNTDTGDVYVALLFSQPADGTELQFLFDIDKAHWLINTLLDTVDRLQGAPPPQP